MIHKTCVYCGDTEGTFECDFIPMHHYKNCKWLNKKSWQFWIKEKYK